MFGPREAMQHNPFRGRAGRDSQRQMPRGLTPCRCRGTLQRECPRQSMPRSFGADEIGRISCGAPRFGSGDNCRRNDFAGLPAVVLLHLNNAANNAAVAAKSLRRNAPWPHRRPPSPSDGPIGNFRKLSVRHRCRNRCELPAFYRPGIACRVDRQRNTASSAAGGSRKPSPQRAFCVAAPEREEPSDGSSFRETVRRNHARPPPRTIHSFRRLGRLGPPIRDSANNRYADSRPYQAYPRLSMHGRQNRYFH